MKNVPHLPPLAIIAIALLLPACRSTRNITSTQSSTTAITQKEMDIATRNAVTTRKRKLTITYIPMLPTTLEFDYCNNIVISDSLVGHQPKQFCNTYSIGMSY